MSRSELNDPNYLVTAATCDKFRYFAREEKNHAQLPALVGQLHGGRSKVLVVASVESSSPGQRRDGNQSAASGQIYEIHGGISAN